jgi:hypothetical protein
MAELEVYDEAKNLARIGAGWKGTPFFKNPNLAPAMDISGQGYPAEVEAKLQRSKTEEPTPTDPWVSRK